MGSAKRTAINATKKNELKRLEIACSEKFLGTQKVKIEERIERIY